MVHRCLGLNRAERKHFLYLQAHKEALRIVATAHGIVTIAPHFIAQGTIDAMVEVGQVPASVSSEYERADTQRMQKFPVHLPFPSRCMDRVDEGGKWKCLASSPCSPAALSPSRSAYSAAHLTSVRTPTILRGEIPRASKP